MKAKRRTSITDGLPSDLSALHRAHRLQERAAGVQFDWPDVTGPLDKVAEESNEIRELIAAGPPARPEGPESRAFHERLTDELGDLLFSCVNLCRKAGVHAALALDRSNAKFARRFQAMERLARDRGLRIGDLPLDMLDELWEAAKAEEREADAPAG